MKEVSLSLILTLAIITGQLIKLPLPISSVNIPLIDLSVFFLCFYGLIKSRFKLKRPPSFLIGALIFVSIAILSLIFTPLKLQLPEYLKSSLYVARFFLYTLLGWLIISNALPIIKKNIYQVLGYSGFILATFGLIQFIFLPDLRFLEKWGWDAHFYRTASTFLDPNFVGSFFVLTLLTLIFFQGKKIITNKILITLFTIVYLALLTTFSRSSYLMFLVSFLTYSMLKKSTKLALVTMVLFLTLLFSFQIYIRAVNRVTPLDRNQTASYRFSTWQQGFSIFEKHPILGVGFNAYNYALRQYSLENERFLGGMGATTNDSSLLHVLATTGILGITAYGFFIAGIIKTVKPILIAAVFGLLAHSVFVNSLFYPFILLWLILMTSSLHDNQTVK